MIDLVVIPVNEPAQAPQVYEAHEPHEPDENHESSAFANLLAGMLQKPAVEEEAATGEMALEISAIDFSDGEIGFANLSDEKVDSGKKTEFLKTENAETDFSKVELMQEQTDAFLGVEHLLNRTGIKTDSDEEVKVKHSQGLRPADVQEADFSADVVEQGLVQAEEAAETNDNKKLHNDKPVKNEKAEELSAGDRRINTGDEQTKLRNTNDQAQDVRGQDLRGQEPKSRNRRDRITFDVHDMRTASGSQAASGTQTINAGLDVSGRTQNLPVQEITLELRLPSAGQNSAQTTWEAKASTAMENMLARELHQNFNGDIVRHASMALRDGGEGMIRLALRPESLGDVKIHLKMSENKITGHIVVESQEALNAFRKEMDSLQQAFREAGFDAASLDLSLSSDNDPGQQDARHLMPQSVAARYDDSFEFHGAAQTIDVLTGRKTGNVNLLA